VAGHWRAKYGGMDASMVSQMKTLDDENRRLKRMFADLSMQNELLKEALGKK
jgi:putative transposase